MFCNHPAGLCKTPLPSSPASLSLGGQPVSAAGPLWGARLYQKPEPGSHSHCKRCSLSTKKKKKKRFSLAHKCSDSISEGGQPLCQWVEKGIWAFGGPCDRVSHKSWASTPPCRSRTGRWVGEPGGGRRDAAIWSLPGDALVLHAPARRWGSQLIHRVCSNLRVFQVVLL